MKSVLIVLRASFIATMIFGTIYVVAQQNIRLSANDAPSQVNQQYRNQHVHDMVFTLTTDIAAVNGVFTLFYDESGKQVGGGHELYGKQLAAIPVGVLKHATFEEDNKITWQPTADLRLATVTTKLSDGYVMSAQSLRPYEERIASITGIVLIGYAVTELIVIASSIWVQRQLAKI